MKIWRLAIIALVLAAGSAVADPFYPVTVDFSGLTTTTDITLPSGIHLDGVTFQYAPVATDTASADSAGIFGDTVGTMYFVFDAPAVGLTFTYSVLGPAGVPASCSSSDCLDVLFDGTALPSDPNPSDTVSYGSRVDPNSPATPFSLVTMYFTLDVPNFTIDSVAYDSAVPEPASFLLFGTVVLGLGGARLFRRRA